MDDKQLLLTVLAHRLAISILGFAAGRLPLELEQRFRLQDPSWLLDASDAEVQKIQRTLVVAGVPDHMFLRWSDLRNKTLPEFTLIENWDQLCGNKKFSGETKLNDMMTVKRFTCENNTSLGEIEYQTKNRNFLFKSFDLENDWAAIVDRAQAISLPAFKFSLTDVVLSLTRGSKSYPVGLFVAQTLLDRTGVATLISSCEQSLGRLESLSSTPRSLAQRIKTGLAVLPTAVRDQLLQLLRSYSVSETQLEVLRSELSNLGGMSGCVSFVKEIGALIDLSSLNLSVWLQMTSQLEKLQKLNKLDCDQRLQLLNRLALLGSMLRLEPPVAGRDTKDQRERVLMPLSEQDFQLVFQETLVLFDACSTLTGHVRIASDKCVRRQSPDVLVVVDCKDYCTAALEPVLSRTSLLLQSKIRRDDLEELDDFRQHLTLIFSPAECRRPLGYYPAYVRKADVLPGEQEIPGPELDPAASESEFVAVRRAVIAKDPMVVFVTSSFEFVVQPM